MQAEARCVEDDTCVAFALRKELPAEGPAYLVYTDEDCVEANGKPDPSWDLTYKGSLEEVLMEDSSHALLCLKDGVYGTCPTTSKWSSPGKLYMFEEESNHIIRGSADYALLNEAGRDMTAEERQQAGIADDEEWWGLPREGPAVKVAVKRHVVSFQKTCGDEMAIYATELDFDDHLGLAIQGPPPPVWLQPAPASTISEAEAAQLIRQQLPTRYSDSNNPLVITDDSTGWQGWVEWCCPDSSDPLYRESTEEVEIRYRLPVTLSEDRTLQYGEPYVQEVEMIGDFHPVLRRDIDGDGSLEVLWAGCQNYWTHDGESVVSNAGNCCGC